MIYIDDSIMQKGKIASAGSAMLEGFAAPFDATVLTRLGGETERVRLGEFGLEAPAAALNTPLLANDVFGHIRAAARGGYYIRPTYGTVSRYGLIPTASSMDQIGVLCNTLDEGLDVLARIAGKDEKDGAMLPEKAYHYAKADTAPRVATPDGVKLPSPDVCGQVLTILAYCEISNNISRYDGVKFGHRADGYRNLGELYTKSRTEGFGETAKLAAVMGAMLLSEGYYEKYYMQAMKLRRLIKEALRFDSYDVLRLPAGSPVAVLAGLPSVAHDGVELVADVCGEGVLRAAWEGMGR